MKKIVFLSSVALMGFFASCDDEYMDQFDVDASITDVMSQSFELEGADYATIAGLSANKELALSKDPETGVYVEALKEVGSKKYFTDMAPGEDYIPAFIANKYPNADLGSRFTVTFDQYQAPAAYLQDFENISTYTLTEEDYQSVWGENIRASFLSPASVDKLPVVLQKSVAGAAKGDMVVVNYAYSELEPSTGGNAGEEVNYTAISEVLANKGGAEYTVKGEVIATYGRGFILSDGTGSILVYLNAMPNNSVGDVVSVSGTTSAYSGLMQFPKDSEVKMLERKETFTYPAAVAMTGAELDAYMESPSVKYASFSGKLKISGNYYNIEVEGATRQGSISYPIVGVVDAALNGENVTVTGYLIGGSNKYVNVMATSVVAQGAADEYTPVGVVALSKAGDFKVKGTVAATYARGFLMTDGTGYILVYKNTECKPGDIVTVSGATSAYAGLMQYSNKAEVTVAEGGSFKTPAPRVLTAQDMEAYGEAPYVAYVSYVGKLQVSGNYYNVIIDGTTAVQGSLSYPNDGLVDKDALNGKMVEITGYTIGSASGGKYLNTMVVEVKEATKEKVAQTRALSRAAAVAPNTSDLYVYGGEAWKLYTNSDARVAVVTPDVYASVGSSFIAAPEHVLPTFLAATYPYAEAGQRAAVVYNKKANTPAVAEYTFNGVWAATPEAVPVTVNFTREAEGIVANMSTYLDETFLGSEGGFTIQNVSLGGLSYVWGVTAQYGWKASAYANNTNNVTEAWIVSPAINFKKAKAPIMTFDEAHRYLNGAAPEKYFGVMISTNYKGDVTTATWTSLPVGNWSDGSTWDFVNVGEIDLAAYIGQTVHIAFKYTSDADAAATWEVKNLKVIEKE